MTVQKRVYLEQRNKFYVGDEVEILTPNGQPITCKVKSLQDENGNEIESTPHPQMKFSMPLDVYVCENSFCEKEIKKANMIIKNHARF